MTAGFVSCCCPVECPGVHRRGAWLLSLVGTMSGASPAFRRSPAPCVAPSAATCGAGGWQTRAGEIRRSACEKERMSGDEIHLLDRGGVALRHAGRLRIPEGPASADWTIRLRAVSGGAWRWRFSVRCWPGARARRRGRVEPRSPGPDRRAPFGACYEQPRRVGLFQMPDNAYVNLPANGRFHAGSRDTRQPGRARAHTRAGTSRT
jgi:hypothetical protein